MNSLNLLIRLVFDALLVLFGIACIIGLADFTPTSFWFAFLLTLTGIFIVSSKSESNTFSGIVVTAIGLFMILRIFGIIELGWFRVLLGGFLIATGLFNLIRNVSQSNIPLNKTFAKSENTDLP